MGQKVNPIGLRLGIAEEYRANWFAGKKNFKDFLKEDVMIRQFISQRYPRGSIARIDIDKFADKVQIRLHTARPGVVLGRKGAEINRLRDELYEKLQKQLSIDVIEVNPPTSSAQFLADSIAMQLEKRTPHRYVIKKAMTSALQAGAQGVKVRVSGRIAGAEISRSEQYIMGKVPLHTLRARIDYATSTGVLKTGTVGVKVWVYLGEQQQGQAAAQASTS